MDAAIVGRDGADADLDRAGRVNDALAHRTGDEATMGDTAMVRPGVLVRIELDQRQPAMAGGVGLKQGVCDEVVAAEGEELCLALDDVRGLRLDGVGEDLRLGVVEGSVAIVDDGECLERVEAERILRVAVEDRRGAAYRGGAEARAGPVGYCLVEGNAPDHCVDAGEVAANSAAA